MTTMSGILIDGKKVSSDINAASAASVERMHNEYGKVPGLAVIVVGDDPASHVYVNRKEAMCRELGLHSEKYELPAETTMQELLALIDRLNRDDRIHGILVQSPPPPHIDEEKVVAAIVPEKDVDCFHPVNVGKMLLGRRDGAYLYGLFALHVYFLLGHAHFHHWFVHFHENVRVYH